MRQILEVMRLRYELNYSQRNIAKTTGIPRTTIKDYLRRARAAELSWPLPDDLTNVQLNELLFPLNTKGSARKREVPNWHEIHKELKRKSVTLQLLWEEYKKRHTNGYQYSWFSHQYRQWAKKHDVWMPQVHKAGEKIFVDYSGVTVPIWQTNLCEVAFNAEIFVAVLGASDLIFCVATQRQCLHAWIEAHNKMFMYYKGVAEVIVPDNLASGVSKAHRYEPRIQATYAELAIHYGCSIMPARSRSPKDKAKVEKAVQLVQQRILSTLRNEKFCSLEQLNTHISPLLEALNNRFSKHFGCSRYELFNSVEKEALLPLPAHGYEMATWTQEKLNGGYHVTVNKHHYSVPYQFVRKHVEIRVSKNAIEIFHLDERIACHPRNDTPGAYSTLDSHRPEAHRHQAHCSYDALMAWANRLGSWTTKLLLYLFADDKRHLCQKERSALGILRLSNAYGEEALEMACKQALDIGTYRYDSLASLIKRVPISKQAISHSDNLFESPEHENVRGSDYYH